jgi:hypothetical protein
MDKQLSFHYVASFFGVQHCKYQEPKREKKNNFIDHHIPGEHHRYAT